MIARVNEEDYARALRASALETMRRLRGAGLNVTAYRRGLTLAVLEALADGPTTAGAVAARIDRDITDIAPILIRLESCGLAHRAGSIRNHRNQRVTLWAGRPKP